MTRYLGWALAIIPAAIFLQSLFFKFSGSEETRIIFSTIGAWMALPSTLIFFTGFKLSGKLFSISKVIETPSKKNRRRGDWKFSPER